jgi:P2-related tail formation protein
MSDNNNILASGIANKEHLAVFDLIEEQRYAALDLSILLLYMFDTVPAVALPVLAEQFDILGYKGFGIAKTEQEKRDVVKNAIALHRHKGTPWAIEQSLLNLGYARIEILEGLGAFYDGVYNYDGAATYGGTNWANFVVHIYTDNENPISSNDGKAAYFTIMEYKNMRSVLVGFSITTPSGTVYSYDATGEKI